MIEFKLSEADIKSEKNADIEYPIRSGDIKVDVSILPNNNMKIGVFEGIINLKTNQNNKISCIPFSGEIISDVEAQPPNMVFSKVSSKKILHLVNLNKDPIKLKNAGFSKPTPFLSIMQNQSENPYTLSFTISFISDSKRFSKNSIAHAEFFIEDDTLVRVPIMIVDSK